MTTNAITPDQETEMPDPSPTTLFGAFADERRQHAVQYLIHKPGTVPLGVVAEYIAIAEDDPTRDNYERILVSLVHTHIPLLTEVDLVRYDADRETVELRTDSDVLRPYLELAAVTTPA